MPQGSVRRVTQTTSPVAAAARQVLDGDPQRSGDRYSNPAITFMLGRQVGTAADRLADDQRRTEIEFNAWVRDQERGAA